MSEYLGMMIQPTGTTTDRVARPRTKRKAPKSIEEQLAEAMVKVGELESKAIENRDRLRTDLIEDLYKRFGVSEIKGDMSESRRLGLLRGKLGL